MHECIKELSERMRLKSQRGVIQPVIICLLPSKLGSFCGVFCACRNLASILVESGVTGHCCSIRGLCGNPKEWHLGSVPFVSLMRLVPNVQDNPTLTAATQKTGTSAADGVMDRTSRTPSVTEQPVIPSSEVSLDGKAYRYILITRECNFAARYVSQYGAVEGK